MLSIGSASPSARARGAGSFLAAAFLATSGWVHAQTILVDFEQLSTAPCTFNVTGPLRDEFAALGVHFRGPTPSDGGAVLDQCGNFLVNPHSGVKFLAFSAFTPPWSNGGQPIDPERISFDQRVINVDIWVASSDGQATFRIDAFDGTTQVGSNSVSTAAAWTLLSISVASGFTHVVLDSNVSVFLYDDLRFTLQPDTVSTPYCFGDGSGTACPCGNHSPVGSLAGCLSSLGVGGRLRTTGLASIGMDSLVLRGTDMPNSFVLYFQGTTRIGAGNGIAFGDGKRCVSGSVIRLKTIMNAGGTSQYPEPGDAKVSVRGSVSSPGVRMYQAWYRNAAPFCSPLTYNLTNGVELGWVP